MKLLLENWRKYLAENKKTGTLNSDYPGYVEVYSPYSKDQKIAHVGSSGDQVEILGSWSDKGRRWIEIDVNGTKGWIDANELTVDQAKSIAEVAPDRAPEVVGSEKKKKNIPKDFITEEKELIYSFDFDNTLIRYRTLEDGDVEYLGPHEENIQLVKNLAAAGNKIIIVTSRAKPTGPKKSWDDSPLPEELIAEFDLPIEDIYYTSGNFKADKLVELGVQKHWDDDDEEVAAAEAAGIEAVLVPVEEGITERLRNKWITRIQQEAKDPKAGTGKKTQRLSKK
jgi:FMN phosphatase YigB (HAD superfamily)